ncbi:hypothetical protein LNV23_18965 [Paucibacter sp. DJ1R-11]|uniref:hypothetical protein n=1 Tax=Paucibacter sp. DJ1R-11 TaxID=2893556 RepID=UPI0021E39CB7|nr:hypothetical protein [Paucibacter sp. DJ1R-11]MCV2365535.1 hypothetical protein [Paucibacter sp. DJ1R-11]
MTITAHDDIIAAILAALRAEPGLAAARIEEEASWDLLPESALSAVSVAFMGSTPEQVLLSGQPIDWVTGVRISCLHRQDSAGTAGRASRGLHGLVYARLMSDITLGGRAQEVSLQRMTSDTEFMGSRIGVLHADYRIQHRSDGATLNPIL